MKMKVNESPRIIKPDENNNRRRLRERKKKNFCNVAAPSSWIAGFGKREKLFAQLALLVWQSFSLLLGCLLLCLQDLCWGNPSIFSEINIMLWVVQEALKAHVKEQTRTWQWSKLFSSYFPSPGKLRQKHKRQLFSFSPGHRLLSPRTDEGDDDDFYRSIRDFCCISLFRRIFLLCDRAPLRPSLLGEQILIEFETIQGFLLSLQYTRYH